MKAGWVLTLAAAIGLARGARAQEVLYQTPDALGAVRAGSGPLLQSADDTIVISSTPLFLGDPAAQPVAPTIGSIRGTANGQALRAPAGNPGQLSIGFDYLRPFWSFRDFTLTVPPQFAGGFPLLADVGHVDNHFAFAPRLRYDYLLEDLDVNVSASGWFLNLTGRLQRDVATAGGGIGNLVANSSLTIVAVNFVEVASQLDGADIFAGGKHDGSVLEDSVLTLSIGSRYASVDQNYSGSLQVNANAGSSVSTRYSTQNFRGFGITTAANWQVPCGIDWLFFSNLRGSLLIGENRKNSTLTVAGANVTGTSDVISESNTVLLPSVEMEMGIEWGRDLGDLLRRREVRPQLTIRVSAVGQYWADIGPLSAGSSQRFRSSDLFLVGGSVQVGFRH